MTSASTLTLSDEPAADSPEQTTTKTTSARVACRTNRIVTTLRCDWLGPCRAVSTFTPLRVAMPAVWAESSLLDTASTTGIMWVGFRFDLTSF